MLTHSRRNEVRHPTIDPFIHGHQLSVCFLPLCLHVSQPSLPSVTLYRPFDKQSNILPHSFHRTNHLSRDSQQEWWDFFTSVADESQLKKSFHKHKMYVLWSNSAINCSDSTHSVLCTCLESCSLHYPTTLRS